MSPIRVSFIPTSPIIIKSTTRSSSSSSNLAFAEGTWYLTYRLREEVGRFAPRTKITAVDINMRNRSTKPKCVAMVRLNCDYECAPVRGVTLPAPSALNRLSIAQSCPELAELAAFEPSEYVQDPEISYDSSSNASCIFQGALPSTPMTEQ
jgi:hypothetical protein